MSLPVSRRALLSAVFPFAAREAEPVPGADQSRLRLQAVLSTSNVCVERHGVSCRRCAEVCDHSAIRILAREKLGAVIDAAACTGCGDCVAVCPVQAIATVPRERVELVSEVARLVAGHG
jgi:ferredoxin-type protein NapF